MGRTTYGVFGAFFESGKLFLTTQEGPLKTHGEIIGGKFDSKLYLPGVIILAPSGDEPARELPNSDRIYSQLKAELRRYGLTTSIDRRLGEGVTPYGDGELVLTGYAGKVVDMNHPRGRAVELADLTDIDPTKANLALRVLLENKQVIVESGLVEQSRLVQ